MSENEVGVGVLELNVGTDADCKVLVRVAVQNDQLEAWHIGTFAQEQRPLHLTLFPLTQILSELVQAHVCGRTENVHDGRVKPLQHTEIGLAPCFFCHCGGGHHFFKDYLLLLLLLLLILILILLLRRGWWWW